ncbi:hypothetical protein GCM10023189_07070 [Nibrella saemangeumensis]|uniref:SH3b domain-containing protein n=2 Tax=Nibrella saemangeumensis TaxID=1084526 RepID=A0ABP8MD67_9BACT
MLMLATLQSGPLSVASNLADNIVSESNENNYKTGTSGEQSIIPKTNYTTVTTPILLFVIGILIMVIIKKGYFDNINKQVSNYEWKVTDRTEVYSRPNINSQVIRIAEKDKGFNSIRETKYFIEVKLDENEQNGQTGFIRKTFLNKTQTGE